jgi:hypothetical protein
MAGVVGVRVCRSLVEREVLIEAGDRFDVSSCGVEFFSKLGIETTELRCLKRPLARVCIDWTERHPHLGGALGAALLNRMLSRSWVAREALGRTLTVTPVGRECLGQVFGGSF